MRLWVWKNGRGATVRTREQKFRIGRDGLIYRMHQDYPDEPTHRTRLRPGLDRPLERMALAAVKLWEHSRPLWQKVQPPEDWWRGRKW